MELSAIPLIDVREGGPVRHAVLRHRQALALRDDCLAWFPRGAATLMPAADRLARRWLVRSASPYTGEIAAIAEALAFPGIWFLNGSYQWGCTALAFDRLGSPAIARTLDWPFPGLGRHVEVARMAGNAGEFFSVTWPGYVGALTAMAPGRFAAAINQAPLWRRTRHPLARPLDIGLNAVRTWRKVRHIPPDQLLRRVFVDADGFASARAILETTPIARPVIFTLVGCAPGERCVIERTEEHHATRSEDTCAANDWRRSVEPWEGRVASNLLLTCSYAQAAENSQRRREALLAARARLPDGFGWVEAPVLNSCTRLAVEMNPARGELAVAGYECPSPDALPVPVGTMRLAA